MIIKNNMNLQISKAVKEDAIKIIEYLNLVGGESDNLLFGENDFNMSVEEEEDFINSISELKTSTLMIGKIGKEIVCIGSLMSPLKERIAHQAEVAISVKKEYWGLEIGTNLLKVLIEIANNNNTTEILHLGVKSDNLKAIKLYEKMGFKKMGSHKEYFKINDVYYDKILMNLYISNIYNNIEKNKK